MDLSVSAEGFRRIIDRLNNITDDARIDRAVGRGASAMQGAVKALTPVDTGNLHEKIFVEHKAKNEWHVATNVEYAIYVEYGTGKLYGDPSVPHTDKPYWTYFNEKLGHFVTTRGMPPAHMFLLGFQGSTNAVVELVRDEVKEIIQHG